MKPTPKKLNELPATAICGNDISSSCLYVSALTIVYAGQYAWISLLTVGAVLFLFRKIYGEVVGALPLNGGAYNALLNTTSKSVASLAATLTILSYMATAVISASEAMHYVHELWEAWPVVIATVILLALFMGITIMGIGESSKVAVVIFLFHLTSLILLSSFCGWYLFNNGLSVFQANHALPTEEGLINALFFGFCAAMLGISGFESSANFVEEQGEGVFRKTLRNMWIVVSVFNPLMAFMALAIIPMGEIAEHQEALLSHMGNVAGGGWLSVLISTDAALVLSGAVLTSFIGVGGLTERMTLDRILPPFLLKRNKKGSTYRISIMFFLLCTSILFITQGDLGALAGVYTIAFLSVMILFGIGNILLKVRRKNLPRPEHSTWLGLLVAIGMVIAAAIGNAIMNPSYLTVFFEYFIPTILIVGIMLNRIFLLRLLLNIIKYIFKPIENLVGSAHRGIHRSIDKINSQKFVYFTKDDDVATLNKVMLYIKQNEHTRTLKVVSVLDKGENLPAEFLRDIDVLDREYPEIKIEFIQIHDEFGPTLIKKLSSKWNIPINFMFIGSPGDRFPYRIEEMGGVRLII
ncbi:APC family permease [Reichenbachiella carrageenanivorans]|uniref:APC family permease n=1 Tax=Reichenbachiella carrageenanivorans TaxID=2979869 RepID=A0ABY6CW04_9BACT|nr:APC family permease [Reichenbachiella carrageenanivorans]UXX78087.1 APC family permease [Reichenbachiella carrageenanivorans]